MKKTIQLLFFLFLGLNACNKEEQTKDFKLAIVDISKESDWDWFVSDKEGNYFFLQESNSKPIKVMLHFNTSETDIPVFFNANGFPEKVIFQDYIFVFSNHHSTYVDFAAIYPNGKIDVFKNVTTDINWDNVLKSANSVAAWSDVIRWTGRVVGAVPCALSIAASVGSGGLAIPIAAFTCGTYILETTADILEDEFEITNGFTEFGKLVGKVGIATDCSVELTGIDCFTSLASEGLNHWADKLEEMENAKKNKINEANSLLNSGVNITTGTQPYNGYTYKTVKIGTQWWFAENLQTTTYRDGTAIPNVTSNSSWAALTTDAYCWYNNDISNKATYGALYNWFAAKTGKLCPVGWHVPADAEWTILSNNLGGETVAGGKMKTSGTSIWWSPNTGATNESGFSSIPGGSRYYNDGVFYWIGGHSRLWSFTEISSASAFARELLNENMTLYRNSNGLPKQMGISVRCIKD